MRKLRFPGCFKLGSNILEEFEAQANILFDYSATDFNHVESAVSTAEMGVRRLAEVAGLPLKGKSFGMS